MDWHQFTAKCEALSVLATSKKEESDREDVFHKEVQDQRVNCCLCKERVEIKRPSHIDIST